MRILIDLQASQTENRVRGIGRYSWAITEAIISNAKQHEVWLLLNTAFPESIRHIRLLLKGKIPEQHIRVFEVPPNIAERNPDNAWRARAAEKIREQSIQNLNPDVVLITSLFEGFNNDAVTSVGVFSNKVKTAVILYDLIPLWNPQAYLPTPVINHYYQRKIDSLKRAGLLLAISEYTQQEAIDVLEVDPQSVVNISAAVDNRFQPQNLTDQQIDALYQRFGISRKVILYVPGGFDSRKNIDGLITAYSLLHENLRKNHQLVIVSKLPDSERYQIEKQRKKDGLSYEDLLLVGYVEDQDLVALYNAAALFVFPSKYEGFGLPVLEAMACGAPVIASNCTSIPEVVGLKDALFDPFSPLAIMKKMAQALRDGVFHEQLCEHGLKQAQQTKHISGRNLTTPANKSQTSSAKNLSHPRQYP